MACVLRSFVLGDGHKAEFKTADLWLLVIVMVYLKSSKTTGQICVWGLFECFKFLICVINFIHKWFLYQFSCENNNDKSRYTVPHTSYIFHSRCFPLAFICIIFVHLLYYIILKLFKWDFRNTAAPEMHFTNYIFAITYFLVQCLDTFGATFNHKLLMYS